MSRGCGGNRLNEEMKNMNNFRNPNFAPVGCTDLNCKFGDRGYMPSFDTPGSCQNNCNGASNNSNNSACYENGDQGCITPNWNQAAYGSPNYDNGASGNNYNFGGANNYNNGGCSNNNYNLGGCSNNNNNGGCSNNNFNGGCTNNFNRGFNGGSNFNGGNNFNCASNFNNSGSCNNGGNSNSNGGCCNGGDNRLNFSGNGSCRGPEESSCCGPLGCRDLGCGWASYCPPRPPPNKKNQQIPCPPLPCCGQCRDHRAHHLNRSPYCCPCRPCPDPCIYRCCEGLCSSYAGHVPGFTYHSLSRTYPKATFGTKNYMQACMYYNTWSKI